MSCGNSMKVTSLAGLSLQTNCFSFSVAGSVLFCFQIQHNSSMYDYTRKHLIKNKRNGSLFKHNGYFVKA